MKLRASKGLALTTCVQCGKQIKDLKHKNRKFCGSRCAASHNNQQRSPLSKESRLKLREASFKNPGFIRQQSSTLRAPGGRKKNPDNWTNSNCAICGSNFEHLKTSKRRYCSAICSYSDNIRPNAGRKNHITYMGYRMDSRPEYILAKFLVENEVRWRKNDGIKFKRAFPFIDLNGKTRNYYPDFYLPDFELWIEVKGLYFEDENDLIRRAAVPKCVVIYSHELKEILPKLLDNIKFLTFGEFPPHLR